MEKILWISSLGWFFQNTLFLRVDIFTSEWTKAHGCDELVVRKMNATMDLYFMIVFGVYAHHVSKVETTMATSATGSWDESHNDRLHSDLSCLGSGKCGMDFFQCNLLFLC